MQSHFHRLSAWWYTTCCFHNPATRRQSRSLVSHGVLRDPTSNPTWWPKWRFHSSSSRTDLKYSTLLVHATYWCWHATSAYPEIIWARNIYLSLGHSSSWASGHTLGPAHHAQPRHHLQLALHQSIAIENWHFNAYMPSKQGKPRICAHTAQRLPSARRESVQTLDTEPVLLW